MTTQLMQWNFEIEKLIPSQVKIKRKIWLKKGKLFLEKKGERLNVYLLGDDQNTFDNNQKILPYLKISSLISSNAPTLKGGGGGSLQSKKEFGKKPMGFSVSVGRAIWPNEAIKKVEKHAPEFLKQIRAIHNKYEKTIKENQFLQIAVDYFYDSETKFVYQDEGFISVMISLEALFNEASNDIKYKLAHRAGFLLGLRKFDSKEVFENLKNFYNYRSRLVHGEGPTAYDPDRYKISEYTRVAIIFFIILLKNPKRKKIGKKKRKRKLLKEIDYAMFDISKQKSLQKEITKGVKDFKLKVPRTFEGTGKNGKYRMIPW